MVSWVGYVVFGSVVNRSVLIHISNQDPLSLYLMLLDPLMLSLDLHPLLLDLHPLSLDPDPFSLDPDLLSVDQKMCEKCIVQMGL